VQLDDRLLEEYINTFYGYGNYQGDWWLIGPEEGGGASEDDLTDRVGVWAQRGRREIEDVEMFG